MTQNVHGITKHTSSALASAFAFRDALAASAWDSARWPSKLKPLSAMIPACRR